MEPIIVFAPDDPPAGGQNQNAPDNQPPSEGETPPGNGETPQGWEDWLDEQPEAVQEMYQSHVSGLTSALSSERESNRDLRAQLREVSEQMEEGSELRNQLEQMEAELETRDRETNIMEQLIDPKTGVSNAKLALAAVRGDTDKYLDRRGNVLLETLQEDFPELFKQQRNPPGNPGSGTQAPPPTGANMDSLIRRKAGRQ